MVGDNLLAKSSLMADGITTKDPIGDASKTVHQNSESRKRSRSASAKPGAKEHIEVVAVDKNGAIIGSSPQTINTPTEAQSLTKVMQEGFANMSGTLAMPLKKRLLPSDLISKSRTATTIQMVQTTRSMSLP